MVPVEPKLSKGGNLLDFLKNFKKRLETHGLDTVTHLPNPEKENEVLSALTHHSRCTREKATKLALVCHALFDAHARADNEDVKELLHISIEEEIQKELDLVKEGHQTAVEHLMEAISVIRVPTINLFNLEPDQAC